MTSAVLSEELQDLLESINGIRKSFVERIRPAGLPLPGQPLPVLPPQVCTASWACAQEHAMHADPALNKHMSVSRVKKTYPAPRYAAHLLMLCLPFNRV